LEEFWRAEWGGDIFFADGSKHSRGVMLFFRPSLCKEVLTVSADKNSRFLIVNASIDNDEYFVVLAAIPKLWKSKILGSRNPDNRGPDK